jgi:hypothetical protein
MAYTTNPQPPDLQNPILNWLLHALWAKDPGTAIQGMVGPLGMVGEIPEGLGPELTQLLKEAWAKVPEGAQRVVPFATGGMASFGGGIPEQLLSVLKMILQQKGTP